MTLPSDSLRCTALEQAVRFYYNTDGVTVPQVLDGADLMLRWLRAGGLVRHIALSVSPAVGKTDTPPTQKGRATMAQITDMQKFRLTADPEDAAGYDVNVPVSFSSADEAIASIVNVEDDPKSVYVVAGAPGSTVITAQVTTLAGDVLSATLAVDVVTGDVARVSLVAGAAEDK